MVIIMEKNASDLQLQEVIKYITDVGLRPHLSEGDMRTIVGVIGDKRKIMSLNFEAMEGVERAVSITASYKLASREFKDETTIINIDGIEVGGGWPVVMAGPCAVESLDQLLQSAEFVKNSGAQFLRGGAFKPRTSPYAFQGLEEQGLKFLAKARRETGLKIVTEVIDVDTVELVAQYADVLQIGARNMQNFRLLRAVGAIDKPVLLKRGLSATIEEWLNAAEYIISEGNQRVIFCERGIRTFDSYTRNTLDLAAVSIIKRLSHLPIIVDPSHATGLWRLVTPMSLAAIAAGADGLMIEMHPQPERALCDGPQSLNPKKFKQLMVQINALAKFIVENNTPLAE